jgi:alkylated DNA repair dioxygenase AlkB
MSGNASRWETVTALDGNVKLLRSFLPADSFENYFSVLRSLPWRQDTITCYGKTYLVPRLQQWVGDPELRYTWSGIKMQPLDWTAELNEIRDFIQIETGLTFNSVLLNLYRSGEDTVGWHSDDEVEFGENPTIASVSLGASRDFLMRHRYPSLPKLKVNLTAGSLLIMSGVCQQNWQHSLPRRKSVSAERINLTFRNILS